MPMQQSSFSLSVCDPKKRQRHSERMCITQAATPAIKMIIGDWYVDELGMPTRKSQRAHSGVLVARGPYALGSSVNSSWGFDTPRRAYRPTESRRRLMSPISANAADIRTGCSTERHIPAMRLASFTAGPMTVKV